MDQRREIISEATELTCLLGYIAEIQSDALSFLVQNIATAEEALNHATDEWRASQACLDSKEDK